MHVSVTSNLKLPSDCSANCKRIIRKKAQKFQETTLFLFFSLCQAREPVGEQWFGYGLRVGTGLSRAVSSYPSICSTILEIQDTALLRMREWSPCIWATGSLATAFFFFFTSRSIVYTMCRCRWRKVMTACDLFAIAFGAALVVQSTYSESTCSLVYFMLSILLWYFPSVLDNNQLSFVFLVYFVCGTQILRSREPKHLVPPHHFSRNIIPLTIKPQNKALAYLALKQLNVYS